ncbi:MAG: methyltransferase domain-containing protein [Candidatus Peribacteria bacterium]|nr:MAG: methyltransferase domain-containing protein [Candidatus Peribacteria bacterium]
MLGLHPQGDRIESFVVDLEEEWPWVEKSADVVTSFFLLEHIADLQHLADSIERVLTDTGVWIFTYFPQRREWVHGQGEDAFKIKIHYHRYEDIEEAMRMA